MNKFLCFCVGSLVAVLAYRVGVLGERVKRLDCEVNIWRGEVIEGNCGQDDADFPSEVGE